MRLSLIHSSLTALLLVSALCHAADTNTAPSPPRADASGNPLRRAPTGHVSNYDEAKVGTFMLPDPLVLNNGQPVRDAAVLRWASDLIEAVLLGSVGAAATVAAGAR
jgi:hypothetical protein